MKFENQTTNKTMKTIILITIGMLIGGCITYIYFIRLIPEIENKAKNSLSKEELKDKIWWIEASESGIAAPGYNNGNGPLIENKSNRSSFYIGTR